MFTKSITYYDVIYETFKDYAKESNSIRELIKQHKRSKGKALLDVACGTGQHLFFLRRFFKVEGLDVDPKLLAIARKRNPGVTFHRADMVDFTLHGKFDVITCLFSSIGYVKTVSRFRRSVASMVEHLKPGGVLILEPWLTPESFKLGRLGCVFVDQPKLKIARISTAEADGRVSILHLHYLVGTPKGVRYFIERHELGLFPQSEYLSALRKHGLRVSWDPKGLMGRGLIIAVKPAG